MTKDTITTRLERQARGKGRFDLLSVAALCREAQRLEFGAEKYPDRDWEEGIPYSVLYSKCLRHLIQWWSGDDKEDHLAAVRINAGFIMEYEQACRKGLDDRPRKREEAVSSWDDSPDDEAVLVEQAAQMVKERIRELEAEERFHYNCKHYESSVEDEPCATCFPTNGFVNWEPKHPAPTPYDTIGTDGIHWYLDSRGHRYATRAARDAAEALHEVVTT